MEKERKNILLSTTRQWNPGDEFILFGVINILKKIIGDFNPIIYNRNPDIRPCDLKYNKLLRYSYNEKIESASFRGQGIILSHFRDRFCDNSFRDKMDGGFIDYIIFAGSPEWYGARVRELYRTVLEYDIKTSFLGIGYGGGKLENKKVYQDVWKKAELITTRDLVNEKIMKNYGAIYLPCPALLSSSVEKIVAKVEKIALIYSISNTHIGNRVSIETEQFLKELYAVLIKKYDCYFVCHYIDELEDIRKNFPDNQVFYSYDAKDYFEIYNQFDFVIGTRVHGIGICASLGIPGVMIAHDARSSTVEGFKATIIDRTKESVSSSIKIIEKALDNANELSKNLGMHKKIVAEKYISLLKTYTSLENL